MIKKISCPGCGHDFPIESALTESIRADLDKEFLRKEMNLQKQLRDREASLAAELETIRKEEAARWQLEREKVAAHAREIAIMDQARKQREQEATIDVQKKIIAKFEEESSSLLKQKTELEQKARSVELEVARGLDKAKQEFLQASQEELSAKYEIRLKEKELQIQQLAEQVKQMGRTAAQKSQQLQGEALEVLLQDQLADEFTDDEIEEVKKGARGGDFNHRVRSRSGADCGTIHVECKNTKEWNDNWVAKAKEDTRHHGAMVTIIVSAVLPKEISSFGIYQGIFACSPAFGRQLVSILRNHMIEAHKYRITAASKGDTKESLFEYFMGPTFRQRIEKMVEVQQAMKESLDREKRAYQKLFAQREKQIESIVENTVGVFGDLQGLLGDKNLPDIALLSLPVMAEEESE